jgi:uncharacterized SAM-binding protein YcdF (DUF218 family)
MLLVSILKSIGAPGSGSFLLVSGVASLIVAFIWPANRTIGRVWLLTICALYVLLSMPVVAEEIAAGLGIESTVATPSSIETLVVLDGDNVYGRVREAERVFRTLAPRHVLVLGHDELETALRDAGIPGAAIKLESGARTTREQMNRLRELVESGRLGRTAVLASQLQSPRVGGLTRTLRLDVALIASPLDAGTLPSGGWRYVPSYDALCLSREAIYEHAALVYYARRGWIVRER